METGFQILQFEQIFSGVDIKVTFKVYFKNIFLIIKSIINI